MHPVPESRITKLNNKGIYPDGLFVLYWMTANRRLKWNYSLDRAIEWAQKLAKPLMVLEAVDCNYDWASERFHGFIINGMRDNFREAAGKNILYYPYVEPAKEKGRGLLMELAKHACLIIADDFPAFFIPAMLKKISERHLVLIEKVDSNGLLPMSMAGREFTTAYSFRRFLQKTMPDYLLNYPHESPLEDLSLKRLKALPKEIIEKWPPATLIFLENSTKGLAELPVDHNVKAVKDAGGQTEGDRRLKDFINKKLSAYDEKRNEPYEDATSNLSPYLHFGHISSHEIFYRIQEAEMWHPGKVSEYPRGQKEGWWGMGKSAEAFLDQLITWRELGFNMCRYNKDYEKFKSLPGWAKQTLKIHEMDNRKYIYTEEELEDGRTHDPLWNAAQVQLVREGKIHNYLRMLWGKKILEWSPSPERALEIMIRLNNRYALDGRDPNSYSGIFWTLGRYDRAWGPKREIFGKVRYMSSANTARKVNVAGYIKRYS
ncbi:MAG: deoxyribodipyrimidine photolyase [Deltaproteobacteria bacterium]|nr:deoxyribodipyrimidine photolyase [Deltaproteobacteria bacterium]